MAWIVSSVACYALALSKLVASGGILDWTPWDWGLAASFVTAGILTAIRGTRNKAANTHETATEAATTAVQTVVPDVVTKAIEESPFPTNPEQMKKFAAAVAVELKKLDNPPPPTD